CLKHDICDPLLPSERASMHQGVLAEVDADSWAWCYCLGEIDGDRDGPSPAVDEPHPGMQLRCEERGRLAGTARKPGAAPFLICLIRPLATRPRIGHALLLRVQPSVAILDGLVATPCSCTDKNLYSV